jgi:hypothetical protein
MGGTRVMPKIHHTYNEKLDRSKTFLVNIYTANNVNSYSILGVYLMTPKINVAIGDFLKTLILSGMAAPKQLTNRSSSRTDLLLMRMV